MAGRRRRLVEAGKALRDRPGARLRRTLQPPAARQLDDEYLAHVADAYRDAVAFGKRPADTMHRDSGIPLGTINRWIALAKDAHPERFPELVVDDG